MKAKHIKKLREKIKNFTDFEISETFGLFGAPFGTDSLGTGIMAENPTGALRRYWKKYARRYKQTCPNYGCLLETTSVWGKYRVTNKKTGWKSYFR